MAGATELILLQLALASTAIGGVFLSFSDFVMRGLALASPAAGAEAMQQINRTVYRSLFLTTFLLLAPLSLGCAVYAALFLDGTPRAASIAATVIYLSGVFLVTVRGNVPMNQRLDVLEADSDAGRSYWSQYCLHWTRLNHVRTLGCFTTGALYAVAAVAQSFGAGT
ncbi:MAG: anthrone oxygenase family protein [Pseudomonadota bacterium]